MVSPGATSCRSSRSARRASCSPGRPESRPTRVSSWTVAGTWRGLTCGSPRYRNPDGVPRRLGRFTPLARVLLARRPNEPGKGLWDLPGGFPDEQEGPLEALEREVREETGLRLEEVALLGIWLEPDYEGRSVFSVTYRASAAPGEPVAADDVAELQ